MTETVERFHCTTPMLRDALRVKLPAGEYALMHEVRDAAGSQANRSIDVLAMSLWPSRGLYLTGIELKTDRGDWRRELRNPAKAESIAKWCHFFVIAAPHGVVPVAEVPDGWGLWELTKGGKWLTSKTAPKLEPQPLTHSFLAAILRRDEEAYEARVREAINAERASERDAWQARVNEEAKRRSERSAGLLEAVEAFEAASGVSVQNGTWQAGNIGRAVRLVLDKGADYLRDGMVSLRESVDKAIAAYDDVSATGDDRKRRR